MYPFAGQMQSWTRWSAWLCLSLMLWMAAAESVHCHPAHTESAPCSICVVAQSAQPEVASATTTPILATIGVLQEEHVLAKARLDISDAGIRGPPVLL